MLRGKVGGARGGARTDPSLARLKGVVPKFLILGMKALARPSSANRWILWEISCTKPLVNRLFSLVLGTLPCLSPFPTTNLLQQSLPDTTVGAQHKQPWQKNIVSKRCEQENCVKRPVFGHPSFGVSLLRLCKVENVRLEEWPGAASRASTSFLIFCYTAHRMHPCHSLQCASFFGLTLNVLTQVVRFCKEHKLEHDIDLVNKRCMHRCFSPFHASSCFTRVTGEADFSLQPSFHVRW